MVSTPWWCCSNSLERIWKSSQINCTYTVVSLIVLLYTRPHSNMLHTSSQFSDWLGFDTFFLSIFCLAQVTLPGQFCPSRHRISFKYIKVLGWLFDIKKMAFVALFPGSYIMVCLSLYCWGGLQQQPRRCSKGRWCLCAYSWAPQLCWQDNLLF